MWTPSQQIKRVGVLGGGQLGRMMAVDGVRIGLEVVVLDPTPECPASAFASKHIVGSFRDAEAVKQLAAECDILTVEIEHVNVEALRVAEAAGTPVHPSPDTIALIQDKLVQKRHFSSNQIGVAPFRSLNSEQDVYDSIDDMGLPLVLKSRRMAYDGRGNYVIRSREEVPKAIAALTKEGDVSKLYAEQWIPFTKELAVMVVRCLDGSTSAFPVVETIHVDSILHQLHAPAPVSSAVAEQAKSLAMKTIASLTGAGIYGVEMFLVEDSNGSTVMVNEIAPRPHNSGHYTIEACVSSQFEQHLRAITGLPLRSCAMKVPAAGMINIFGAEEVSEMTDQLSRAIHMEHAAVHWYGKKEARPGRKMAHVTVTASSPAVVTSLMSQIRPLPAEQEKKRQGSDNQPLVGIIMGSDSDLPVMQTACAVLESFDVPFEVQIVSAHRTTRRMVDYAASAHQRGLRVIIAGAGGAAHLPGMVAAVTSLPVIGVPVKLSALDGMDSLLSIVQMPRGVPVATVAINNSTNAALLALRILGCSKKELNERMQGYMKEMEQGVLEKVERLDQLGWKNYTKA